jgi:hypothetical protein
MGRRLAEDPADGLEGEEAAAALLSEGGESMVGGRLLLLAG